MDNFILMTTIFIQKEAHKFSAAHMTVFENGQKERLHGHGFQLSATFELKEGMWIPFSVAKGWLSTLCEEWDEVLFLPEKSPHLKMISKGSESTEFVLCGKRYVIPSDEIVYLPYVNIIVETLTQAAGEILKAKIKGDPIACGVIEKFEVTVSESPGQGARKVFIIE